MHIARGGGAMNHELKPLIEELGVAINEALGESEDILEILAAIKRDDYDAFLALNATIVIQKREPEAVFNLGV
jgi:hypothetical protein